MRPWVTPPASWYSPARLHEFDVVLGIGAVVDVVVVVELGIGAVVDVVVVVELGVVVEVLLVVVLRGGVKAEQESPFIVADGSALVPEDGRETSSGVHEVVRRFSTRAC
jgi:hypothetical protein